MSAIEDFIVENFGHMNIWKDGPILYAENDMLSMAYAYDPERDEGSMAFYGPDEVCVEFISASEANKWRDAPERRRVFAPAVSLTDERSK